MSCRRTSSPAVSPCRGGNGGLPSAQAKLSLPDVFHGLRCTPSRRSLKFFAGPHARHFLAFDTAISREDRLFFFMELFVFRHFLVDAAVLPAFQLSTYTPEELLEVRVVTDPRHPAYGQAGLYAKSTIPHNTIVTPYAGFIEVFATSCNSRTYTMGFGSIGDDYALDAEFVGNYGRYANDPRGVGTLQANLTAENRFNSRGESFTALVARRQINAGEEILMSYGKAHRLSATPWTTIQGEPLMRPRMGGVVPFPSFRSGDTSSLTSTCFSSADASPLGGVHLKNTEANSSSTTDTDQCSQFTNPPSTAKPFESSKISDMKTANKTDNGISLSPLVSSVANDLLWECTQCGMWNLCEASIADTPQPCSACGTLKLSGVRFMSLLSSPAVTQRALLEEAGLGEHCLRARLDTPLDHLSFSQSAQSPSFPPSSVAPAAAANGNIATPVFSCEHSDWPMNVPFLPWQVWDAAVPLSVVSKHSRFETQEHMFLYIVDTGLGEERKKRGRERTTSASAETLGWPRRTSKTANSVDEKRVFDRFGFIDAEEGEGSGDDDDDDDDDHGSIRRVSTSHAKSFSHASLKGSAQSSRRNGGGASAATVSKHNSRSSKKGALWERQGDVDPEELAQLNCALTPTTQLLSSPTVDDTAYSAHVFSLFSHSPRQLQQECRSASDATKLHQHCGGVTECRGGLDDKMIKSPLSLLVSATPEFDRLIVLRSTDTSPKPSIGVDKVEFSLQIATMRRRLQCMTRRLFTGKAFQPGDVVSNVGGLVRHREDSRCRVSDSCLEIPLRYFLPPALRKLCRLPSFDVSSASEKAPRSTLPLATSNGEGAALYRFCQRVDGFSLVVTNEFMYCPCVVWEEEEEDTAVSNGVQSTGVRQHNRAGAVDEVASVLAACNVALVLTLDSLGCPYACAVATKAIGAFEPLLARAQ